ncbi:MAG: hypothetical protein VX000_04615 [Myxococcota bacterium]|nr:hypothetical protein [Myxococcota bacterium]
MNRILPALLLTATLPGCTAIRSTVHLTRAEQAYALAVDAEAETWAPYAHERAHSLLLKAREEWSYSDFGPAEDLFDQSKEWSDKARLAAEQADRSQPPPGSNAPGLQVAGAVGLEAAEDAAAPAEPDQ